MRILAYTLFFLLITAARTNAAGGGSEVGNATDNPALTDGAAWFLGADKKIQICYRLGPQFSASQTQVENAIRNGMATWRNYLNERGVLPLIRQQSLEAEFTTDFQLKSACDGKDDLVFLFAVTTAEVEKAVKGLENPTAMAVKTAYTPQKAWGKGFIWLAPDSSIGKNFPNWQSEIQLNSIILHELGHVFGSAHVRGTIMDEYLSQQLQNNSLSKPSIDQRNQLAFCWKCTDQVYTGRLGYPDDADRDTGKEVFKRFTGRTANGTIKAELHMGRLELKLVVSDRLHAQTIDLQFNSVDGIHSAFDRGERLFKAVWTKPDGSPGVFDFFNGGRVEYGSIKDATGGVLNLVLEVNSHSLGSPGPLTLRWLENGKAHSLFFANPE